MSHDTSIVIAAKLLVLSPFSEVLTDTFIDSLDVAFVIAAVVLIILVPVGIVFKAVRPRRK